MKAGERLAGKEMDARRVYPKLLIRAHHVKVFIRHAHRIQFHRARNGKQQRASDPRMRYTNQKFIPATNIGSKRP
jgi:hypothetical protein